MIDKYHFVIIMREEKGSEIAVRKVENDITLSKIPISELQLRQRFNPDIQFYIVRKDIYDNESQAEYILGLIEKQIASTLYIHL